MRRRLGLDNVERLERWLRFESTDFVFPREVGKYRDVVYDFDEFLKWFEENRYSDFCWASLYSNDQLAKSSYDTLFLDFDINRTGAIGFTNILMFKNVVEILSEQFPKVRVYYSGVKGFHLYLDFGKEIFFYKFREAAREFVKRTIGQYILPDMSSVGDVRRMVRVVGNIRRRNNVDRKMIELCSCGDLKDWNKCIENFEDSDCSCISDEAKLDRDLGVKVLIDVDEGIMKERCDEVDGRILSRQSLNKIPPCVVTCFTELVDTGELNHSGRVLLANWLIQAGFSDEDVVDVFRVAKDFKESYTRYQVEFLRRKMYKLPSCKKVMSDGYCPYKCEFFPWMQVSEDAGVKRG